MPRKLLGLILIASLIAVFSTPASAYAARLKICQANSTGTLFVSGNCGKRATRITNVASLKGEDGQDGASFYDVLPSGVTITGVIGGDFDSDEKAEGDWRVFHSFPAPIGRLLSHDDVIVANTEVVNDDCLSATCLSSTEAAAASACTGTATNPTAPAGKVCIYPDWRNNAHQINGFIFNGNDATSSKGFLLDWSVAGNAGDHYLAGSWAYTQP